MTRFKDMTCIHALLMVFLGMVFTLQAAEFRPTAVSAATETYSARYAAEMMIDGDLATYACFQDDTRNGKDPKADPPFAAAPVTCSFVLDLGEARETVGIKFVSRNCWAPTMASDVSVWACGDAKGTQGLAPLECLPYFER